MATKKQSILFCIVNLVIAIVNAWFVGFSCSHWHTTAYLNIAATMASSWAAGYHSRGIGGAR